MARILRISPDEYHQRDGLSASIATTLIARSPLHARAQHPKFGGKGKTPTKAMDRGTIVHALVLGKGKTFAVLEHDDYRKKAAQEERDAARDMGLVPILRREFDEAQQICASIWHQLGKLGVRLDGESELAIEWQEPTEHGPVLCRGMVDHIWLDRGAILDLKVVSDARQDHIERSAEQFGYAIQAAAYRRALAALKPEFAGKVDFLFAFVEAEEPYAANLCRPDGAFAELGERRWLRAVETWARCLATNNWPSYGDGVNPLSPPAWVLAREDFAA